MVRFGVLSRPVFREGTFSFALFCWASRESQDDATGNQQTGYRLDEVLSRKTLGQLLAELKKYVTVSNDFEQHFDQCRGKRNYLTHHFFWAHAEDMLSREGCEKMINELKSLSDLFREADMNAQRMSKELRKIVGWPEEALEKEVEKFFEGRKVCF